jgi:hypothetical protein
VVVEASAVDTVLDTPPGDVVVEVSTVVVVVVDVSSSRESVLSEVEPLSAMIVVGMVVVGARVVGTD